MSPRMPQNSFSLPAQSLGVDVASQTERATHCCMALSHSEPGSYRVITRVHLAPGSTKLSINQKKAKYGITKVEADE